MKKSYNKRCMFCKWAYVCSLVIGCKHKQIKEVKNA